MSACECGGVLQETASFLQRRKRSEGKVIDTHLSPTGPEMPNPSFGPEYQLALRLTHNLDPARPTLEAYQHAVELLRMKGPSWESTFEVLDTLLMLPPIPTELCRPRSDGAIVRTATGITWNSNRSASSNQLLVCGSRW